MNTREALNLPRARELAKQVVDKQGRDFVYNPDGNAMCMYRPLTDEDTFIGTMEPDDPRRQTGCLVGRILDEHGERRHRDERGEVDWLASQYPGMIADSAAPYLAELQRQQDQGETWGAAYDYAEQWLKEEMGEEE